jgi:phosphotransferase system enzyme I (PtsI)
MTDHAGTVLSGYPASPGIAVGPALRMIAPPRLPMDVPEVLDEAVEINRLCEALEEVAEQFEARAERASGQAAKVLEAQSLMARDPGLTESAVDAVCAGKPAPWALATAIRAFQHALSQAGGYFADRVGDLDDLANRTIAWLLGEPMPGLPESDQPYVLVAVDLAPADTVALESAFVAAIVTERGGPTSHTAILAKAAGLPAVVNCPAASTIAEGDLVIVDAHVGQIVVGPSEEQVRQAIAAEVRRTASYGEISGPGKTADDHHVSLLLNLGTESGIEAAAQIDAEGVGLFRTEFLFLDRTSAPDQQEQQRIYRTLFREFAGRTVTVRTLDAGSDKPLAFVPQAEEPNPALGVRGFRTRTAFPELLDTQLAAIAQAAKSSDADVRVMAPMISTSAEAEEFADLVRSHDLPVAGVMIEVPAAALRAQRLLAGVDFVSIGTNDLSQYTYAADRGLAGLADLLDPWQPALLELVGATARAGKLLGKPVGVCGEAASDPLLVPVLVGLGVTSLSMSPPAVTAARAALRQHTLASCESLAERVLTADGPKQARDLAKAWRQV